MPSLIVERISRHYFFWVVRHPIFMFQQVINFTGCCVQAKSPMHGTSLRAAGGKRTERIINGPLSRLSSRQELRMMLI
jgi:hypothetical protein